MSSLTRSKKTELLEEFLKRHRDRSGELKYRAKVSGIINSGSRSIVVDYGDLLEDTDDLAKTLISDPDEVLPPFNEALFELLRVEAPEYAEKVMHALRVNIRGLPETVPLRGVTSDHLNKFIAVSGMVVRASELKPLALQAVFLCGKCGAQNMVEQEGMALKKPPRCVQCGELKSFEMDEKRTKFIDYQIIRMQELPEELPPGQLPQSYDVDLFGDVVNTARPGDRSILTGIVRSQPEYSPGAGKLRVFRTKIEGNFVEPIGKEAGKAQLTKEDEPIIKSIASQPNAYDRLIESIAPEIYGYETQKESILLQIAGSPQRTLPDGAVIRGDLNLLFVGDPGTAKSEFLKYSARIAPRGLYTSGRGSTAAGLTAAVVRDRNGMLMLEAGAVVLADQGIACIDEFDKMRVEDRNALHECMEQQTCSVAKGGIVATLNARTSILAASNPVLGKYDPYKNITENVNLPIPLLTRFDLIFVVRDMPDRATDEKLARHILGMHRKGDYASAPPISFDLLRKYLAYAKRINPVLTKEAENLIVEYYLRMRSIGSENMITVTPRQLEGLIRLATARARLLFREQVLEEDALRAISLVQRMLETVGVDVRTGKVDPGVLYGKPVSERAMLEVALEVFKSLGGPEKKPVEARVFVDELVKTRKLSVEDAQRVIQILRNSGQIYEPRAGFFRRL